MRYFHNRVESPIILVIYLVILLFNIILFLIKKLSIFARFISRIVVHYVSVFLC